MVYGWEVPLLYMTNGTEGAKQEPREIQGEMIRAVPAMNISWNLPWQKDSVIWLIYF
jgi:hypothetical protein